MLIIDEMLRPSKWKRLQSVALPAIEKMLKKIDRNDEICITNLVQENKVHLLEILEALLLTARKGSVAKV